MARKPEPVKPIDPTIELIEDIRRKGGSVMDAIKALKASGVFDDLKADLPKKSRKPKNKR